MKKFSMLCNCTKPYFEETIVVEADTFKEAWTAAVNKAALLYNANADDIGVAGGEWEDVENEEIMAEANQIKKDEAESQVLKTILKNTFTNIYFKIYAIYTPDAGEPFPDCFLAAVDLFEPGMTFRLYFKTTSANQIKVEHLERWYMG